MVAQFVSVGLKENHRRNSPYVKLIFKPKRLKNYEVLYNLLPELAKFEDEGRIIVLRNTTTKKTAQETKTPPIYPGLASDLVIGLGISSAATECYFGGTMALHADLTNFSGNKFNKTGTNKFIFKSVHDLELGIKKYINSTEQQKLTIYSESKPVYDDIEPFQDGRAFDRGGFILAQLLDSIRKQQSRADTYQNLKETYDKHLRTEYSYNIL